MKFKLKFFVDISDEGDFLSQQETLFLKRKFKLHFFEDSFDTSSCFDIVLVILAFRYYG